MRRPPPSVYAFVSAPIDTPPSLGSLGHNQLCGLDYRGNGTYTAEGITKLCEGLKGSTVTSLECAAGLKCLLLCQRPLTQKRTPLHSLPCQKANTFLSEHTFLPWPAETFPQSLANAHAHALPSTFLHIHAMPPSIVRRVDRGHVLLSDGWVARAPAPISHPRATSPRHSLGNNNLNDQSMQAVKDAAGSGVSITF